MDRPPDSEGEEAEKRWILRIREFMRTDKGEDDEDENGPGDYDDANHSPYYHNPPPRPHARSGSELSRHQRSYSAASDGIEPTAFPQSMSNESFITSPPVDETAFGSEHGYAYGRPLDRANRGRQDSSSTRDSSTTQSTETVTPRQRAHAHTKSGSISQPPSPPSSEGASVLDHPPAPPPAIRDDGYPSPSPSPVDAAPSHAERLPPSSTVRQASSSSSSHPILADPSSSVAGSSSGMTAQLHRHPSSHGRNASVNSQPQRLSQLLNAKKSLPDLRQPHSQIISDRQAPGMTASAAGSGRWAGNAIASGSGSGLRSAGAGQVASVGMVRTTSSGEGSDDGHSGQRATGGLRSIRRKLSDDGMRRANSPLLVGNRVAHFPSLPESNPLDPSATSSPPDAGRDSYFRRLSTLQGSTLPKTVPPALLALIDSARGLLFALSQIQTSLRQHSLSAIDGVFSGVLAKVLAPAGEYTDRLINALDRFDSMSRRAAVPPPDVIRGVVEACKDDVAVFGKVVAVLLIQVRASSAQHASSNHADVRFSRTLLLILYGAMAEVANAWTTMHPLVDAVAPLLRDHRPTTPTHPSVRHRRQSVAAATRTPISPIPERAESHSPASIHHQSPVLARSLSAQPFPSHSILGSPSPAPAGSSVLTSAIPLSTPGPPSQAARSKSRRHAGSFSTQDVQIGGKIPPMPSPAPGSAPEAGPSATPSVSNGKPSISPPIALSSHQVPLRSALRNPFSSPTSSPNPGAQPSSTAYDTSPFSQGDAFPPRNQANGLHSHHTVNGSLSPNPATANGASSGGHPSYARHGGGHSTTSSISSSVGVPISPRNEKERSLFGGHSIDGGGSRGDATNRVVDEEMLDTMGVAVENAFGVWILIEEELHQVRPGLHSSSLGQLQLTPFPLVSHQNIASPLTPSDASTSPSSITPPTTSISPATPTASPPAAPPPDRRTNDLLALITRAEQLTRQLYQSIATAAPSYAPTSSNSTLADDAHQFFSVVVQVAKAAKDEPQLQHGPGERGEGELKKHVKQSLKNLTRLCAASATLLQVSSMRRPETSLGGGGGRPMSPEEHHQLQLQQQHHQQQHGLAPPGGGMRPLALALGRSRSATGGAATMTPFALPTAAPLRSAQPSQQAFARGNGGGVVAVGGGA